MPEIPEEFRDLFERRTFAHVATLTPDGFPHVTPVWIDYDAEANRVLVNTAKGRQKHVNVENDPRVGMSMTDPDDPYRALSVIGEVDEMTEEGAAEHIDSLERRYRGNEEYLHDRTNRIVLKIRPDRVITR
ncbi:PPOX class F420-dependent oxidoreductase [Salinirubellus sp. GCM10025818]|uniref:pyridoxamine 5'-phosphate oxidase family protein n=1 Tax=Salinirubellus TaxID=2162630 RepID=UPI0030D47553